MEETLIAQRIKHYRLANNLTLDEVAKLTGFTKGLLSKIENKKVSPPVSTLVKIAKALGISLGDLFSPADSCQIRVIRKSERLTYVSENYPGGQVIQSLVNGFQRQKIEPMLVSIDRPDSFVATTYNHPGQEFIFVLVGKMKYSYDNEVFTVSEGDSLYFNAEIPHGPIPVAGETVKYLSVLCP